MQSASDFILDSGFIRKRVVLILIDLTFVKQLKSRHNEIDKMETYFVLKTHISDILMVGCKKNNIWWQK